MFSNRTSWLLKLNRLAELVENRYLSGKPVLDLINSNPTLCGIKYPEEELIAAILNSSILTYDPNPRGLFIAREAVCTYYKKKNIAVKPDNLFLTASTSEAYSILFKLLCNVGENILVPKPSYPLLDYLAQLNDVELLHYNLRYDPLSG